MNMLPYARFHPLPLREVRPAGWLQNFLERQSTGLTGNVAVSGYPYDKITHRCSSLATVMPKR